MADGFRDFIQSVEAATEALNDFAQIIERGAQLGGRGALGGGGGGGDGGPGGGGGGGFGAFASGGGFAFSGRSAARSSLDAAGRGLDAFGTAGGGDGGLDAFESSGLRSVMSLARQTEAFGLPVGGFFTAGTGLDRAERTLGRTVGHVADLVGDLAAVGIDTPQSQVGELVEFRLPIEMRREQGRAQAFAEFTPERVGQASGGGGFAGDVSDATGISDRVDEIVQPLNGMQRMMQAIIDRLDDLRPGSTR